MCVQFEASMFCYKLHAHGRTQTERAKNRETKNAHDCFQLVIPFPCEDEVDQNFRDLCGRDLTHQNTPGVVVNNPAPDQRKAVFVFSLSPKVGFKRLYGVFSTLSHIDVLNSELSASSLGSRDVSFADLT